MLSRIFRNLAQIIRSRLKTFDENEKKLYSRTLFKFVDSLTDERKTTSIRDQLIGALHKELKGSVRYPSWKPFIQLQQVTGLGLVPFGSSIMGTSLSNGDLDLSLNGVYHYRKGPRKESLTGLDRQVQVLLLLEIMRFLKEKRRLDSTCPAFVISTAKVPIVRWTDRQFGIQCDVSIGNRDGIQRSRALEKIIASDDRIRLLILLIKKWAKVHKLNDPSQGSFGSYPLTVIVLSFCVEQGVLDPSLLSLDTSPEDRTTQQRNQDSIIELTLSLFCYLSCFSTWESLATGPGKRLMICCRKGGIVAAQRKLVFGRSAIFVEDPFAADKNCAKPVTRNRLHKATNNLQMNFQLISNFLDAPAEDRKAQWQALFRYMFQTDLKFKGKADRSPPSRKRLPQDNELLQQYDLLINSFLSQQKSKKFNIPSSAFQNWFLMKLQKKYVESNPDSNDVNSKMDSETFVM